MSLTIAKERREALAPENRGNGRKKIHPETCSKYRLQMDYLESVRGIQPFDIAICHVQTRWAVSIASPRHTLPMDTGWTCLNWWWICLGLCPQQVLLKSKNSRHFPWSLRILTESDHIRTLPGWVMSYGIQNFQQVNVQKIAGFERTKAVSASLTMQTRLLYRIQMKLTSRWKERKSKYLWMHYSQ